MKITKLDQFHVDCGWEIYSFLKISTDEGVTGWSEFREHRRPGIAAAIHGMGELLIGEDPRAIGRLDAALYSFTRTVPGGLNQNAGMPGSPGWRRPVPERSSNTTPVTVAP